MLDPYEIAKKWGEQLLDKLKKRKNKILVANKRLITLAYANLQNKRDNEPFSSSENSELNEVVIVEESKN